MKLAPALQTSSVTQLNTQLPILVSMMISTASPTTTFDTLHDASALTGSAVLAQARALVSALLTVTSLLAAAAGVYLVKSALGINLLPWHSPLHDILYHFVR
jgi:hypothetical protein